MPPSAEHLWKLTAELAIASNFADLKVRSDSIRAAQWGVEAESRW